jgi:hypothetical protein
LPALSFLFEEDELEGFVSVPGAVATGSGSPAGFLRFLLIRSLPLLVLIHPQFRILFASLAVSDI